MKHRTTLTLLFAIAAWLSHAQEYEPFVLDDFERTGFYGEHRGFEGEQLAYFWTIESKGDTVINGQNYVNILIRQDCKYEVDFNGSEDIAYSSESCDLVGGLREENKRVYFYRYSTLGPEWLRALCPAYVLPKNEEHLLFDFSLEVGDTVNLSYVFDKRQAIKKEERINSLTGYKGHIMEISDLGGEEIEWVEGYGSSTGLFSSYLGISIPYRGFKAYNSCLTYRGESIVDENCGQCDKDQVRSCESLVSTEEEQNEVSIKVFPNPTNGEVIIESNKRIKDVIIRNTNGQVLARKSVEGLKRTRIEVTNFAQEALLIEIQTTDGKRRFELLDKCD